MTTMRSLRVGAVAFAALIALAGCAESSKEPPGPATTSAAAETHNQADVMFAQHMIPHHEQAIEMSDIVLAKQGIDPRVVTLANQIKAAQGPEIEQMKGWLKQWGQPTMPMGPGMQMPGQSATTSQSPDPHHTPSSSPTATPSPTGMPGMPGMPGMAGMVGMMSDEDIAALQNAQGVEASKLYLTQMIEHHQGAITMAQTEVDGGQYAAAITLARSVIDAQQKEITTMQGILATL